MELNKIVEDSYQTSKSKGFWEEERNVGEMLMLIVSELGEAIEAHRKDQFTASGDLEKIAKLEDEQFSVVFKEKVKDTFQDEIADAAIRIFDLCGGLGIDLEKHIESKLRYNATRAKFHGKTY